MGLQLYAIYIMDVNNSLVPIIVAAYIFIHRSLPANTYEMSDQVPVDCRGLRGGISGYPMTGSARATSPCYYHQNGRRHHSFGRSASTSPVMTLNFACGPVRLLFQS